MTALTELLKDYVEKYDYDLKSIRQRYCGPSCGEQDLITFTEIYNEEMGD